VIRQDAPAPVRPTSTDAPARPRPPVLLVSVIAGAWALAIAAEVTGRGALVHHHAVGGTGQPWLVLTLFFAAWLAHVVAMMLPSSLPLLVLHRRASADQDHPHLARGALLAGYLLVWIAFGAGALAADGVLHEAVHREPALDQPRLLAGAVLALAGAMQFSTLKDRCLQQCRNPGMVMLIHYRRGIRASWDLGLRHGLHCLGCCWALMLVMFAVGTTNLAWMAPLALLMVHEKAGKGGDRHVRVVGAGLLVLGVLVGIGAPGTASLIPAGP
jgi:predicted metal-binding membrane protein